MVQLAMAESYRVERNVFTPLEKMGYFLMPFNRLNLIRLQIW